MAKFILNQVLDSFKAIGTVAEGVFTLDWEKVKSGWADGMKAVAGNVETMVRNIASNTADAFNETLKGELKEVSVDLNSDLNGAGASASGTKPAYTPVDKEPSEKEKAKAAKEAEKAAKEELKRLHELEESKISMMAEGHEKELAMIRLKFKKKLDEISGNGETENALRVQLVEQCRKEIADCESKYQKELAKINLENSLASVEKGSREELDLRLAKLESQRMRELEAAEKTGADKVLIDKKFDKERLDLQDEFAEQMAQKIQERYAGEQSDRDNAMMGELNHQKRKYAEELSQVGNNEAKRAQLKERYESKCAEITDKYAMQSAKASIAMIEEILTNDELSAEDRLKFERDLAKAKCDLETAMADHAIEEMERQANEDRKLSDERLERAQKWLQVASDGLNAINELSGAIFDAKIQRIEEEQEANTEAGEAEQERISELVEKKVITEEEGEARKRAAEIKTAKKNEELEKKKQKLQYKQALWDKANSVAQLGIATALSLMKLWNSPGWPAAIPMMAVVSALGAAQLATILATPIPKYAKGTDHHKGGPAIVGDGGVPELVILGGRSWITPDTPTLVDLPTGAVVVPDIDGIDGDTPGFVTAGYNGTPAPVIVHNDYRKLEEKMDSFIYHMRQHSKRQHQDAKNLELQRFIDSKI